MKINFSQKFNQNPDHLIRRCGYGLVRDPRAEEVSYSRRLGGGLYPRFHLYINSVDPLVLNLHLDQKQASYEGYTKHSGDYDSELVKQEADKLYDLIMQQVNEVDEVSKVDEDGHKGFFRRLFGK
ncbi:MAG: hypothetical protein WC460_00945 [Patescibacteria group bacterium]